MLPVDQTAVSCANKRMPNPLSDRRQVFTKIRFFILNVARTDREETV